MFFFFFKNKQIIMVIYSPVEYLLANYDLFQPYIYFQLVALILTLSLSLSFVLFCSNNFLICTKFSFSYYLLAQSFESLVLWILLAKNGFS